MSQLDYVKLNWSSFGRKKKDRILWQTELDIKKEHEKFSKVNRLERKILNKREPSRNETSKKRQSKSMGNRIHDFDFNQQTFPRLARYEAISAIRT